MEIEIQVPHLAFVDNWRSEGFVTFCLTFKSELPMWSPFTLWCIWAPYHWVSPESPLGLPWHQWGVVPCYCWVVWDLSCMVFMNSVGRSSQHYRLVGLKILTPSLTFFNTTSGIMTASEEWKSSFATQPLLLWLDCGHAFSLVFIVVDWLLSKSFWSC